MAIKSDYHMHTSFSGDSTAPMEQMILKGIELGLNSICFTEHMDMDFVYEQPSEEGMFDLNTDSYLYDFIKYKGRISGIFFIAHVGRCNNKIKVIAFGIKGKLSF